MLKAIRANSAASTPFAPFSANARRSATTALRFSASSSLFSALYSFVFWSSRTLERMLLGSFICSNAPYQSSP